MCFLLMVISAGCSKDDDSNDIGHKESCISGQTLLFKSESLGDYVCIVGLKMPQTDDQYNYIKVVVVSKDELPSRFYYDGMAIDFNIVEVKHIFPSHQPESQDYPTTYLCSIELCK